MRKIVSLNQNWLFSKSEQETANAERVNLPHTWNVEDGQDGGNDYWRGTAVYRKQFAVPEISTTERVFIEFRGAAMTADVILNGTFICHHEGGYSTFRADITGFLQEQNLLEVFVDNSSNDRVYPQMADFTFYGGIYRDVNMIIVPSEHFELVKNGTPGIKVTPVLKDGIAEITVETWQNADVPVMFTVAGQKKLSDAAEGHAQAVFMLENPHLWDGVNDPYLYEASAELPSGDAVSARFGVRSIAFDPDRGFFLNGRSYPLRGIARHQDRAGVGNALTTEHHREDMKIIREIGANTVRLAHYQHAQEFYDLCDENGLIVWAEIPYITEHMPGGRENTLSQMRELITQCYNHPSIVCWGLSNEITAHGAVTDDMLDNHRALNDLCHSMDATRPTTMAHVFMLETDSPLIEIADIGSYNLYFGWYLGELEQNDAFFDKYHAEHPSRVIGFSEYGADANVQFHAAQPEKGDYSEEYQCLYHEHILDSIEARPFLWATYVWNMFDFAADGRDEGGKKGVNQKGLVSMDRKLKKDAFYLYKAAWSKESFVHLCGRRYADRVETETEVKVYSNCASVALYVDGQLLEEKAGKRIFTFTVPITCEQEIKAVSGLSTDTMIIRHVTEPNSAYQFRKQEIVNWFEKEELKPNCFSVWDTLGALNANQQAAALVAAFMAPLIASRGDVAQSASGNEALQRMMAAMSLESMLRQAGDAVTAEQIKALNSKLQQIGK